MSIKKGIPIVQSHAWWFLPVLASVMLVAAARHAAALIGLTLVLVVTEGIFVRLTVKNRSTRVRIMAMLPLLLFALLSGGVLLFLERMIIKIPMVAAMAFLFGFAHYIVRYAAAHPEFDFRTASRDAYRMVAYASIYCIAVLFFAIFFYFGVTTGAAALALLALPLAVSAWRTWFEGLAVRERIMHTIAFEIIFLEVVALLIWLPVPYIFSALIILLVYFLYSEYVLARPHEQGQHEADQRISFIIAISMLVLLLVLTRFR